MDDRDAMPDGGVVQEVAGREVVGSVDDDLPAVAEDAVHVVGGQPLAVGDDLDVGVQPLQAARGGLDLRLAELGGRWSTWRWRFDSSTASSSTIPRRPTPAAAR